MIPTHEHSFTPGLVSLGLTLYHGVVRTVTQPGRNIMKYSFERFVETLDLWSPQTITHVDRAHAVSWMEGVRANGIKIRDMRDEAGEPLLPHATIFIEKTVDEILSTDVCPVCGEVGRRFRASRSNVAIFDHGKDVEVAWSDGMGIASTGPSHKVAGTDSMVCATEGCFESRQNSAVEHCTHHILQGVA